MINFAIIPCYNVNLLKLKAVIKKCLKYNLKVICIDDRCPNNSGKFINNQKLKHVKVIFNKKNLGVGGAVKAGYNFILKKNFNYAVKVDGDGQINPLDAVKMINFCKKNKIDYCSGTRFEILKNKKKTPFIRWYGNKILSFFSQHACGKYNIGDFLNGLTCINNKTLKILRLKNIRNDFFFETNVIFELCKHRLKITSFAMNISYFENASNFHPLKEAKKFAFYNLKFFIQRVLYDFHKKSLRIKDLIIIFFVANFILIIIDLFLGKISNLSISFVLFLIIYFFLVDRSIYKK